MKDREMNSNKTPDTGTSGGHILLVIVIWMWRVLRVPLFLIMYWLRGPIVFVCNLVSVPSLLAWLVSMYAFPTAHVMIWTFGVFSFLAFVFAWVYDFVLMELSPHDMATVL